MSAWLAVSGVLLALLVLASVAIVQLKREQQQLRQELRRTLRAGAGSVEAQLRELAWRQAAMESADLGLIVTDRAKAVLAMNDAAASLFGQLPPGSNAILVLRHYALEHLLDQALAGADPAPVVVALEGRTLRAHARTWPLAAPIEGAVLSVRDITDRQQLTRARRDFIANIGHELRTPLASLKLLVETLQTGGLEDGIHGPRVVARLYGETEAMIRLVEDMTALALIESGRTPMRLAPTPLSDVVAEQVRRLAPQADARRIRVLQDVPPGLTALLDRERFGQVLTNLLDNAIKFTPEGGTVTISAAPQDESVRLQVEDSGDGILPGELSRIFERFYKSDFARDRGTPTRGTGLGLAIAKHLVEAHGGRIWAESPAGRGAIIIVELPLEQLPNGTAESTRPSREVEG